MYLDDLACGFARTRINAFHFRPAEMRSRVENRLYRHHPAPHFDEEREMSEFVHRPAERLNRNRVKVAESARPHKSLPVFPEQARLGGWNHDKYRDRYGCSDRWRRARRAVPRE